MTKYLHKLLVDLAALFFGVLLTLAFAPFQVFPFAIVAIAGLLYLWLQSTTKWHSFWLGFLFGLGLFTTGVYWVFHSIHVFGGVPSLAAGLITAGMIAILACFPATAGYVLTRYFPTNNTTKILCAFPAIWVFSEWVRSWLFTGFPWLFVGYSQTNSPLKGFAPLFSVYGVTLAAVLTSALIVKAILSYRQKSYRDIYFCLFACVIIWTTGSLFNLITWTTQNNKLISISLVQGNIPQELKWSPEHLQLSLDRYEELSKPLWGKSQFIIWPEAAIPMTMSDAAPYVDAMEAKAKTTGTRLILGIPVQNPAGQGYFNSVVLLGDKEKSFYYKRQLVPFGEYVPFENILAKFFNFMNIPVSELVPSTNMRNIALVSQGVKIFTSICYEIAFPEFSKVNDPTIGLILTVTNDAWFGESSAQAQHLQMAAMRAIELGRPVVFVSNDGITAIIGPNGEIQSAIPVRIAGVLTSTVQPMLGVTPWMYFGMDPILFILLCMLTAAIAKERKLRKDQMMTLQNQNVT